MKNLIRLVSMVFALGLTNARAQNQQVVINWDINMSRLGSRGLSSNDVAVGQGQVYVLLLDYTGSMNSKDDGKNSRWELLKKSLASTIINLPSGCEVIIKTFSIETNWRDKQEWKTEEVVRSQIVENKTRLNIIDKINGLQSPDKDNATNLYDAIGEACKNAGTLISSGKSVTLIVFTDGQDTGSRDFCAKDSEVSYRGGTRKKLDKHFEGLFLDKGFQAYELPLMPKCDTGSVFPPTPADGFNELCAVNFPRNELILSELRSQSVVTIPIDCDFPISDSAWKRLMGSDVKEVDVSFSLGKIATTEKMKIRDGKVTVRMEIDGSKLSSEKSEGKLTFSGWPTLKGLVLLPPKPIRIVLPEVGKIALDNLRPSSSVIQTGSAIPFMVDVTPKNAQVRWFFSGPQTFEVEGAHVAARTFTVPGKYEFLVKATAANLESAEKKGTLEVLDFSIEVVKPNTMPVVNEDYEVSCRWKGPCERVEWIAEKDQVVTEMGRDRAKYRFFSSGDHKITVKAFSSKFPTIDAKAVVNVKKAPVVYIDKPVSGGTTELSKDVELIAKTEGGVQSVKWEFLDANGKPVGQLDAVVAGDGMAKGIYQFPKKGTYSVRAVGSAGSALHKSVNPVTVRVTSPDAKIDIVAPVVGDKQRTGDNLVFKAHGSVGAGFKELTWSEVQESGKKVVLGVSNVAADGFSECKILLDHNTPDRSSRIVVEGKDSTGELVVAPEVLVHIYTECDVDVLKPLEGEAFPYGTQVVFAAKVICNVPDYRVEWILEETGKALGNSKTIAYAFTQDGANAKLYKVSPEIVLPGGRRLKKEARGFKMYCPDLKPMIKLPGDKSIFGINESVDLNLDMKGSANAEVTWSFGSNGPQKKGAGRSENHAFDKTGECLVFAVAKCKACGKEEKAQPVKVLIGCPQLEPKIIVAKTNGIEVVEYGLNEPVTLNLDYKGGVPPNVLWSFGDGTQTTGCVNVSHAYTNYGPKVIFGVATCKLCGKKEDAEHKITIVKRPPVASFVIFPDKDTFTVGGEITLRDKSVGDVASITWITNGVEVVGEPGGTHLVRLSKRPGSLMFGLRANSSDGQASPVYERTIHVRFGWWAVLPILLLAGVSWWLLFRVLTGNEPIGWTVYSWDGAMPRLKNGGYPEERNYTGRGIPLAVKAYWNCFSKKAQIPLSVLLGCSEDSDTQSGGWNLVSSEEKFIIRAIDGKPHIEPPNVVIDVSGTVADRDADHYYLFMDAGGAIGDNNKFIRLVVEEASPGWFCKTLLIALTFLIIGTVFWLCLEYAV